MFLFFDCETTGLPKFKAPFNDPSQPHICQLAAILTDEAGNTKGEINLIIEPDGWTIPEETSAIHGITQKHAENYGVEMMTALVLFANLMRSCDFLVAHNAQFDKRMVERDSILGKEFFPEDREWHCTMLAAKPIVKCPPTEKMIAAGFNTWKSPNLQETYTHFFGEPFEGAHDAMADVRACKDVFFKMRELQAA